GLFKEFPGPALCAITADGEEDIDAAADEVFHSTGFVHWTARSAQNRAGLQMNAIHQLVCENERLGGVFRIQPLMSPPEAEHLFYPVGVMQLEKQRSDYIVESGTQSSAGNNASTSFGRIEEQFFTRACQFKEAAVRRPRINGANDGGGDTLRVV